MKQLSDVAAASDCKAAAVKRVTRRRVTMRGSVRGGIASPAGRGGMVLI